MTTKYNPNDGTGRWYEDEPKVEAMVVLAEKKNDFVVLALFLALAVIGLMII